METPIRKVRIDDETWRVIAALPGATINDKLRGLLVEGKASEVSDSRLDEVLELARSMAATLEDALTREPAGQQWEHPSGNRADLQQMINEKQGHESSAVDPPKNAFCKHCGQRFAGSKFATLCRACEDAGHARTIPAECSACTAGSSI